jgi:MYXO-CTERM domain-containing protein
VPDADGSSDAGVDAGTPSELEWLFPPLGATGVVINPSFLLRARRVVLEPVTPEVPEPMRLGDGLLLRDPLGHLVAVGSLLALQPPRYGDLEPRVELSSAPLELKANTRYEVLSRIGLCGGTTRSVCLEDEYHPLGAFETGIVFDHTPPSIRSIEGTAASLDACVVVFSAAAFDDLAPPSALRFVVAEQAWLGPSLVLQADPRFFQTPRLVQVVPVDPSGNRGAAVSVNVGSCGRPPLQIDDTLPSSEPPRTIPPPLPGSGPPRREKHGCSFTAGAAPPAHLSVLVLAGLWLRRRRQRRS